MCWCRGCPPPCQSPLLSESSVDHVVDVVSERNGIDGGESLPSTAQLVERDGGSRKSGEFGHRLACTGDGQLLSALGALDYLSTSIAQIADRDVSHVGNVSRVIRGSMGTLMHRWTSVPPIPGRAISESPAGHHGLRPSDASRSSDRA